MRRERSPTRGPVTSRRWSTTCGRDAPSAGRTLNNSTAPGPQRVDLRVYAGEAVDRHLFSTLPGASQHRAQLDQVEDAGVDLDPTGGPGPAEVQRAAGQRQQVVAGHAQPDLRAAAVDQPDVLQLAVPQLPSVDHPEVAQLAGQRPVLHLAPDAVSRVAGELAGQLA